MGREIYGSHVLWNGNGALIKSGGVSAQRPAHDGAFHHATTDLSCSVSGVLDPLLCFGVSGSSFTDSSLSSRSLRMMVVLAKGTELRDLLNQLNALECVEGRVSTSFVGTEVIQRIHVLPVFIFI